MKVSFNFVNFLIGMGMVWFVAWAANPNIDSGTVWLLAYIFGSLHASVNRNQ